MFAYLNGILEEVEQDRVILDVNGVGYMIKVPTNVLDKLPSIGSDIKLYTYFVVREDSQELYGFIDRQQKAMFEKLITVSGIGPKGALSILSVLDINEVVKGILVGDIATLIKAPGVGKKTAQRIILELRDKMDEFAIDEDEDGISYVSSDRTSKLDEVVDALVILGYTQNEIKRALYNIKDMEGDTSVLIKAALKNLDI
ncbi:MAG TPA: Holliday junction branch migration protein RuvA [Clostridiales bacterium]|nr:Holliday junction branch migration protein RuvA [Clostridiales bacterium]